MTEDYASLSPMRPDGKVNLNVGGFCMVTGLAYAEATALVSLLNDLHKRAQLAPDPKDPWGLRDIPDFLDHQGR